MKEIEWTSIKWNSISSLRSISYDCGYCGESIASNEGYFGEYKGHPTGKLTSSIYICHHCSSPSFFDALDNQYPGPKFGYDVDNIDDQSVQDLYDEAKLTYGASAFTASVMCCRKILMNLAVSKGAEINKTFIYYIDYLLDEGHISSGAKDWVTHIKDRGNEANHEIEMMEREDAEELINFVGIMLKSIYEFPAVMKRKKSDS